MYLNRLKAEETTGYGSTEMPCNDVTEAIEIALDNQERVIRYSLSKVTCGGSVAGADLLHKWIADRPVDDILAIQPEAIMAQEFEGSVDEWLRLKHLLALQATLGAYTGQAAQANDRLLTITGINFGADGVELSAVISLPLLTEEIKACGLCGDRCRGALFQT